jgi:hypothetical protein
MGKYNTLKCSLSTIENTKQALSELIIEYPSLNGLYEINLKGTYIEVVTLGRVIHVDYYHKEYGKVINSDEVKNNPLIGNKYESVKISSLSTAEIREIILNGFSNEF